MTRITTVILLLLVGVPLFAAGPVDINNEAIYMRRGFEKKWLTVIAPSRDWRVFKPEKDKKRSIVLSELPDSPKRSFLSLEGIGACEYTFIAVFSLSRDDFPFKKMQAYYSANIGENWEVYLNGRLVRSEMHLDEEGNIKKFRHIREVLLPLDSCLFRIGKNTLAVRIKGDPANIDSGFHRSVPFTIEDFEEKRRGISETGAIVLIFLYLFFGLYHLFIYSRQTEEKYNLYYGIFSVLLFVYLFSRSHTVYGLTMNSNFLHRLEYASLFALLPVIGAFLDILVAGRYSIVTKLYSVFYSILIVIVVLPFSNSFSIDILRIWQFSAMVPLAYYALFRIGAASFSYFLVVCTDYSKNLFPVKVLRAAGRTLVRSTAGNLLFGTLIMLGCAVFDILDSMFWSYEIVLTRYGFFIFMAGITLILANRFLRQQHDLVSENKRHMIELKLATDVQMSLLPDAPLDQKNWDIALSYIPKYGASGDCYDFYYKDNMLKGISLFDVSGHGTAAALIATIIKPIARRIFNRMEKGSLDRVVERINKNISMEISDLDHYVSGLLLRFQGRSIEYVNMGHPDILLRKAKSDNVVSVGEGEDHFRGEFLGANISNTLPRVLTFSPGKGDTLIIFTDGILEAMNYQGKRYGMPRLKDVLKEAPADSAKITLDFILEDFFNYLNLSEIQDDFTLIVLKKK